MAATLRITKKLENISGNIVASADQIAFTEQEINGVDTLVLSVKAKIQALDQSITSHSTNIEEIRGSIQSIETALEGIDDADNIMYDTNVTVKDKLDELALAIDNIEIPELDASDITYDNGNVQTTLDEVLDSLLDYVDSAETAATNAESSYQNLLTSVMLALSQVSQIQEAANDLTIIKQDYANINNIANNLLASLNLGYSVQVMTEDAYAALSELQKNNGTIYLLYNTHTDGDYYMVVGFSANSTMGTVVGSNNNAYTGTTVTLQAIPNTGYVFDHWTNNIDSILTTGDTLIINASRNIVYYATFVPGS